jgi:hypothetical protein
MLGDARLEGHVATPREELVRARAVASVALVSIIAALLTGCGYTTPVGTVPEYNPSDGINADIGELALRNVLVVSDDGVDGNLVMVAINNGATDIDATLQYETDGTKHEVEIAIAAKSSVEFGFGDAGQLLLEDIGVKPGGLLDLYVQYGDEPGELLEVPVIDETLAEYEGLKPTPKPTPKPTATVEPTETPTP